MALLTLTTLSLGIAVAGDALGSGIAGALAGGVAGNYAHEACKGALQAVAELAQQDQLFANHVLLRAVRRSHLRATRYGVEQFRLSFAQQPADQVRHLAAWCDLISTWLDAEVAETRSGSYRLPHPELLAEQAAQLAHRPEGETADELRDALASQVLAQLRDELQDWHEEEVASRRLMPNLPEGFLDMLARGWLSQPLPEPALQRVLRWFTRRRGAGAQQVQRRQARLAAADRDAGHTTWFAVYAAFFAHELHVDPAVQAAFTNKLLTHLVLRSGPPAAARLRDELERWGAGFCSHIEELGSRLDAGQARLLGELVRAQTLAERDSLVLRDVAQGIAQANAKLDRIEHLVAPAAVLKPWQLPPRAIDGSFSGRVEALQDLTASLRSPAPCICVLGPAGFGKTALAAEALAEVVGRAGQAAGNPFPDGVVLLDLYRLRTQPDAVWSALAASVLGAELPGQPTEAPEQRALRACAGRRLLVVVEGAELADGLQGAALLDDLLAVLAPENSRLVLTRDSSQALPAQTVRVDHPLDAGEAAQLFDRLAATHPPAPAVRTAVLALLQGHPLALTWAASLLADPAEDAQRLAADWQAAALPSLNDPLKAPHTLDWLFQRSLLHLDADAVLVLQALGLLAHAPVPLSALSALFLPNADASAAEGRARAALKRLVQRALLLRGGQGGDETWQFTHVLAYGFARARAEASPAALSALLGWAAQALMGGLAPRVPDQGLIARLLQHAAALLALADTDADADAGFALFAQLQYRVCSRLLTLGQLSLAAAGLDAAGLWFTRRAVPAPTAAAHLDRERSVWLNRSGDVRVLQGRLGHALEAFQESLALSRRLADSDPGNAQRQRDLGVSLNKVGSIQQAQGRLEQALDAFEEHLALSRRLAESDPSNTLWQRDLGISLDRVGGIHQAQGRLEPALQAFEESLALSRQLADSDPSNTEWRRDLGVSLNKVGGIHQAQGRLESALTIFGESLAQSRGLAESDPSNTLWQRDLGVSLNWVGGIQQAQGRLEPALQAFEEYLALSRRLADSDLSNTEWQRDLGVSLYKVGGIHQVQGRLEAALKAYEEHLALSRRLAESDPSNTQWQRDLSVSLTAAAEVLAKLDRRPAACRYAQESLAIDERLAALAPDHVVWQDDVAISRRLVARVCGEA